MKVKCDHRSKFSNLSNWKEEAWNQKKKKPWIFFRLLLSNCLNWKIYCDDHISLLFSERYFQSSSEFTFLWNLGKFEIRLNQARWQMEFVQNCTFSTRQYRKTATCLDFIFTRFVIYPLVILLRLRLRSHLYKQFSTCFRTQIIRIHCIPHT